MTDGRQFTAPERHSPSLEAQIFAHHSAPLQSQTHRRRSVTCGTADDLFTDAPSSSATAAERQKIWSGRRIWLDDDRHGWKDGALRRTLF